MLRHLFALVVLALHRTHHHPPGVTYLVTDTRTGRTRAIAG